MSKPQTASLSRRQFLKTLLGAGATGAAVVAAGGAYSALIEPHWLTVERVNVSLQRLPREFDGFTVAQVSDVHRGPYIDDVAIRSAVETVNQLQADAVVLTGDFVTRDAALAEPCADILGTLQARSGVYAILGNHDHWSDADEVTRALQAQVIAVLRNAASPIDRAGARLWIAGVDDVWERRADLDQALRLVPADQATILLAHEPDYADVAAQQPIDLQLSGHSHGGQVQLPFFGPPILPYLGRKYPRGPYQIDSLQLYTNRGLGVISPPVRFNCRPEITLFTLRAMM
jgi:predicted MPP superfamily phosphohydrolase